MPTAIQINRLQRSRIFVRWGIACRLILVVLVCLPFQIAEAQVAKTEGPAKTAEPAKKSVEEKGTNIGIQWAYVPIVVHPPQGEEPIRYFVEFDAKHKDVVDIRMALMRPVDGIEVDELRLLNRSIGLTLETMALRAYLPLGISYPSDSKVDGVKFGQPRWVWGLGLRRDSVSLEFTLFPTMAAIRQEIDTESLELKPSPYRHAVFGYQKSGINLRAGFYSGMTAAFDSAGVVVDFSHPNFWYLNADYRFAVGVTLAANYVAESIDGEKIHRITGVRVLDNGSRYLKVGYEFQF